jgi:hypothetical protein
MRVEFSFRAVVLYIAVIMLLMYVIYFQSVKDIVIYPADIFNVEHKYYCRDHEGNLYEISGSLIERKTNIDIVRALRYNLDRDILVRVSGYNSPYYIIGRWIINVEHVNDPIIYE